MAETVEETYETEVRRKIVRTSLKIEEVSKKIARIPNLKLKKNSCAFFDVRRCYDLKKYSPAEWIAPLKTGTHVGYSFKWRIFKNRIM